MSTVKNTPAKSRIYEHIAYLRERIYGVITLLGISIGLLINSSNVTAPYALAAITTAALSLWVAGVFSELVAYRVVHDAPLPKRELMRHVVKHNGILVAAVPSLIFLTASILQIVSLRTALIVDIVLSIFSLSVIMVRAAVTPKNSVTSILMSLAAQALIALLIIALKVA